MINLGRRVFSLSVCGLVVLWITTPAAQTPKPKRINRAIELLEQGQPIYYTGSHSGTEGSFEQGVKDAQTWADYISYDMEHAPFDVKGLADYMKGLVEGRADQERPPHAGGHRQRAGERHRRSHRSRQRVDVPPGAGDRRSRHSAVPRRRPGRRQGVRRSRAPAEQHAGRRQGHQRRTARRARRRHGGADLGSVVERIPQQGRRLAAESERRAADRPEAGRQIRARKRRRQYEGARHRLRRMGPGRHGAVARRAQHRPRSDAGGHAAGARQGPGGDQGEQDLLPELDERQRRGRP